MDVRYIFRIPDAVARLERFVAEAGGEAETEKEGNCEGSEFQPTAVQVHCDAFFLLAAVLSSRDSNSDDADTASDSDSDSDHDTEGSRHAHEQGLLRSLELVVAAARAGWNEENASSSFVFDLAEYVAGANGGRENGKGNTGREEYGATATALASAGGAVPPLPFIASLALNAQGEIRLDAAHESIDTDVSKTGGGADIDRTLLKARARADFAEACTVWPGNPSALVSLGWMARMDGDLHRAIELFAGVAELSGLFRRIEAVTEASMPSSCGPETAREGADAAGRGKGNVDAEIDQSDAAQLPEWVSMFVLPALVNCVPLATHRLGLLQALAGDHDASLHTMQKFGFRFALARGVWAAADPRALKDRVAAGMVAPATERSTTATTAAAIAELPCHVFANAVRPELRSALLSALSPASPYWAENDYDTSEYFSWWYDVTQEPRSLVELAIRELLPYTGIAAAGGEEVVVGAEWWAHTRPVATGGDIGHQLHFDTDELDLEATGVVKHPRVSSVVYISAGGDEEGMVPLGGPTVVFDQEVDATAMASRAWVVPPVAGAFMTFPGTLLHGVLPTLRTREHEKGQGKGKEREEAERPVAERPRKRARTSTNTDTVTNTNARAGTSTSTSEATAAATGGKVPGAERLTILIGWWTRSDFAIPAEEPDEENHPERRARRLVPYGDAELSWPAALGIPASLKKKSSHVASGLASPAVRQVDSVIAAVTPAWEDMGESAESPDPRPALEIPHHNDLRLFAQSPRDFHQRMMEEHFPGGAGDSDMDDVELRS